MRNIKVLRGVNMTRKPFAVIIGIGFLVAGILGFVPHITVNGLLLNIFAVDPMHNWVYIISGVIALLASVSDKASKLYFQLFGIIYAVVAIMGFVNNGQILMMQMNMADNYLHVALAIIILYLGFIFKPTKAA